MYGVLLTVSCGHLNISNKDMHLTATIKAEGSILCFLPSQCHTSMQAVCFNQPYIVLFVCGSFPAALSYSFDLSKSCFFLLINLPLLHIIQVVRQRGFAFGGHCGRSKWTHESSAASTPSQTVAAATTHMNMLSADTNLSATELKSAVISCCRWRSICNDRGDSAYA